MGLKTGDIRTVVMIHANGSGYELEFIALYGETIVIETLSAEQVRPIARGEIANS